MKEVTERSTNPQESTDRSLGRPNFGLSHIVAPTDFSSNSKKAVDYAIQLARRMGARLTLLHIVPEPGALDYNMEGISVQELQDWKEEATKRLADELARAKLEYQQVDAVQGSALYPHDQIVFTASV